MSATAQPSGTDTPPPTGEAHVWIVELDPESEPNLDRLSAEERERAARIRDPAAAARWGASRLALREVLGRYLGEPPEAIRLHRGEHGKPRLGERPERLCFNLSHSEARALIAVCDREVGVDIEFEAPRSLDFAALAARGIGPEAAAHISAAPPTGRARLFYPAWAAHEARLKCLGSGFGSPPPKTPVAVVEIAVEPGYAAALAVASSEPYPVRLYRFERR